MTKSEQSVLRHSSLLLLLALLVTFLTVQCSIAQDGRLQQVRDAVDNANDDQGKSSDKKKSDHDDGTCDHSDGIFDTGDCDGRGELFLLLAFSPFVLPHVALNDTLDRHMGFPSYPFAHGQSGYLQVPDDEDTSKPPRWWAGRLSVEEGNDFSGLNRVGARLSFETAARFGIQSRIDWFSEKLACGCRDDLLFSSTELTYRFAQSQRAQFYAGIGPRLMSDDVRTRWGFNFTYGADFFPARSFVVSLSLDAGTLGHAGVFQFHGTAGWMLDRFELFGGYDYRRIGPVDLQGPLVGVRLWY